MHGRTCHFLISLHSFSFIKYSAIASNLTGIHFLRSPAALFIACQYSRRLLVAKCNEKLQQRISKLLKSLERDINSLKANNMYECPIETTVNKFSDLLLESMEKSMPNIEAIEGVNLDIKCSQGIHGLTRTANNRRK